MIEAADFLPLGFQPDKSIPNFSNKLLRPRLAQSEANAKNRFAFNSLSVADREIVDIRFQTIERQGIQA